jgi:hypothetical protein
MLSKKSAGEIHLLPVDGQILVSIGEGMMVLAGILYCSFVYGYAFGFEKCPVLCIFN